MSIKYISTSLILSLLVSISLFTACEYEFIEPEPVVIPEFISFGDDIQPIFNKNCSLSGCHVTGNPQLDLSAGNAYNQLLGKNLVDRDFPEQSKIYLKLTDPSGTHQPKGRSTPQEQAAILEWIKKGAKNN